MRSNDIKSSATKSSKPIKSRLRLSLAITAIAMVFVLASGADAAQRVGSPGGSGGRTASSTGSVDQGGGGGVRDGRQIARRTAIAVRPASERRYVRDEVLIQVASSVPNETIVALGQRLRLDRAASFTAPNITTFRWTILDRRPVPAVVRSLEAEPIVLAAHPNYAYQLEQAQQTGTSAAGRSSPGASSPVQLRRSESCQLAKGEGR